MKNDLLQATINTISGHEFRTPMNAIFGFANLLHDSAGSISAAEQKEYSNYILNSARQLMNLSERLERWSRFKEETIEGVLCEKISVEAMMQQVEKVAGKYTVPGEIFLFSANTREISIPGNKEVFFAAMAELFDNAFKFSAKQSVPVFSVMVENGNQLISIENYSDKVSSTDLRKYTVFTQFNRKLYEQQGLGLGLEIARLGILHCGGRLSIPEMPEENGHPKIRIEVLIPCMGKLYEKRYTDN